MPEGNDSNEADVPESKKKLKSEQLDPEDIYSFDGKPRAAERGAINYADFKKAVLSNDTNLIEKFFNDPEYDINASDEAGVPYFRGTLLDKVCRDNESSIDMLKVLLNNKQIDVNKCD